MEVLTKQARSVRLQELVEGLRDKKIPPHGVTITFDDG
jgi:hypothetical protein